MVAYPGLAAPVSWHTASVAVVSTSSHSWPSDSLVVSTTKPDSPRSVVPSLRSVFTEVSLSLAGRYRKNGEASAYVRGPYGGPGTRITLPTSSRSAGLPVRVIQAAMECELCERTKPFEGQPGY